MDQIYLQFRLNKALAWRLAISIFRGQYISRLVNEGQQNMRRFLWYLVTGYGEGLGNQWGFGGLGILVFRGNKNCVGPIDC